MMEHGYTFDFFSENQLKSFANAGKQIVTGGNTYQTILLPANELISDKSFAKLVELAKNGATVLVYKNLPKDVPGLAKLDERRAANRRNKPNGTIEVMVQLKPFESTILQLFNTKKTGSNYPYTKASGKPQNITGDWTLSFVSGGPKVPATITNASLGSWTNNEAEEYKVFSGTAKYTINFAKPQGSASAWVLDLGKVNETAEVILNGKKIATLIGPSFNVVIQDKDLKQNNTLEILVSNLMANRITYMDKNEIPWKKFYNINMSARKPQNVKKGVFDASNWEPLPSGLTGPVTFTPVAFNIK
jgi:hypothetical protein